MHDKLTARQCLAALWMYLKPHQARLWLGMGLTVLIEAIAVGLPLLEGSVINQIQKDLAAMAAGTADACIHMDAVGKIVLFLLMVYVLHMLLQYVKTVFLTDSVQACVCDLRNAVQEKINRLPVSYFDEHPDGDILSKAANDTETVSAGLQQTLEQVLSAVFNFIFGLMAMLYISVPMTCFVLAGLPLVGAAGILVWKKSQPVYARKQQALSALSSTVSELYQGSQEILAYNAQEMARNRFELSNREVMEKGLQACMFAPAVQTVMVTVTCLEMAVCTLMGCLQVMNGSMSLGHLQAMIRYIGKINQPVSQLAQLSSAVQSAFAGTERLAVFLNLPEEEEPAGSRPVETVESVDFEGVEFSYGSQALMKGLSFHADKGQTIAIVGPTGSGKTTITSLLLRFYRPKSGSIKISGTDIQKLSSQDLRSLYGLVGQEPWLFEGTVQENLLYGSPHARTEDMVQACQAAGIHEWILQLPEGYETVLSEDAGNLSEGEKQLLTIARALIKDPKILILDEATSSVDTRIEKRMQKALDVLMKTRTCFVVAHRLSTIVNADLILVMDQGTIVEQGSHKELLKKNGRYAQLYQAQYAQA